MPEGNKNACAGTSSSRRKLLVFPIGINYRFLTFFLLPLLRVADIQALSLLWKHLNPNRSWTMIASFSWRATNLALIMTFRSCWYCLRKRLSSADADWFGFNFDAFGEPQLSPGKAFDCIMRFKLPGGRVSRIIWFVTLEIWVFLVIKTAEHWLTSHWLMDRHGGSRRICLFWKKLRNTNLLSHNMAAQSRSCRRSMLAFVGNTRVTLDSLVARSIQTDWNKWHI